MQPEGTSTAKVVLVDDHDLIRRGLRQAFESSADFAVIGEAGTVHDGAAKVAALRPDGVVLDVRLPDGTGLELAAALRQANPELGIVVLTMYAGDDALFAALESGANAFVAKEAPATEVVQAMRQAIDKPGGFSADGLAAALHRRDHKAGPVLTEREQQVLQLLADGFSVAQIARRLHLAESTVKTHIAKIYSKLGAGNRAQAIMTAMQKGLLRMSKSDVA